MKLQKADRRCMIASLSTLRTISLNLTSFSFMSKTNHLSVKKELLGWDLVGLPVLFKWEMPPSDRVINAEAALGRGTGQCVSADLRHTDRLSRSVCGVRVDYFPNSWQLVSEMRTGCREGGLVFLQLDVISSLQTHSKVFPPLFGLVDTLEQICLTAEGGSLSATSDTKNFPPTQSFSEIPYRLSLPLSFT